MDLLADRPDVPQDGPPDGPPAPADNRHGGMV
ncbi:hypothetical protein CBM2586_A11349 [Cupriavidus phytorum]|uniref:Uncharacterized protein n=1 Tax=Cupriavidus taiwanensis TaxID=164546 RepID=A0A375BDT9_9BURK|nr:hypothetical protein CBM2586_A11349 [Cupriavidus taiwanensis]